MPVTNYRLTSKDTIPQSTALNGTVTTDSQSSSVLNYAGTSALNTIYGFGKVGLQGEMWIYVAALNKVARVLYVVSTGTNMYNIFLDRAFAGASGAAAAYVEGKLLAYTYKNDGGTTITVNGVSVLNGEGYSEPQDGRGGAGDFLWVEPQAIDPNGGSVLIYQTT